MVIANRHFRLLLYRIFLKCVMLIMSFSSHCTHNLISYLKINIIATNWLTKTQPTFLNNSKTPTPIDVRLNTTNTQDSPSSSPPTLLNNSPPLTSEKQNWREDVVKSGQFSISTTLNGRKLPDESHSTSSELNWTSWMGAAPPPPPPPLVRTRNFCSCQLIAHPRKTLLK